VPPRQRWPPAGGSRGTSLPPCRGGSAGPAGCTRPPGPLLPDLGRVLQPSRLHRRPHRVEVGLGGIQQRFTSGGPARWRGPGCGGPPAVRRSSRDGGESISARLAWSNREGWMELPSTGAPIRGARNAPSRPRPGSWRSAAMRARVIMPPSPEKMTLRSANRHRAASIACPNAAGSGVLPENASVARGNLPWWPPSRPRPGACRTGHRWSVPRLPDSGERRPPREPDGSWPPANRLPGAVSPGRPRSRPRARAANPHSRWATSMSAAAPAGSGSTPNGVVRPSGAAARPWLRARPPGRLRAGAGFRWEPAGPRRSLSPLRSQRPPPAAAAPWGGEPRMSKSERNRVRVWPSSTTRSASPGGSGSGRTAPSLLVAARGW